MPAVKHVGEPRAEEPHERFDAAGQDQAQPATPHEPGPSRRPYRTPVTRYAATMIRSIVQESGTKDVASTKVALKAQSLVDTLRIALRDAILRGEIPAGTSLAEQAVADRYGVARPTAKAAVEQLVHAGLLRRSLHRAARVPVLSLDDVLDLYFNRGMIECWVVSTLAERESAAPDAERAVDDMRRATELAEVVEADVRFHRSLVAQLGSPRAVRLHESVIGEAHLFMAQVQVHKLISPEAIMAEHQAILAAIAAGDGEKADALMSQHLLRARDRLLAHLPN